MKRIKVLISGNPFSWNFGSMALVVSSVNTLLESGEDITFFKGSVEKDKEHERYSNYYFYKKLCIFGFNKKMLPMPVSAIMLLFYSIPYYMRCDLVLENCGETSKDAWLLSQFSRFLFSKVFGKKFIIYGVSTGPFKYKITRLIARLMYNNCEKLLIRERISINYLKEIGVTKRATLVADHAFLLPLPSEKRRAYLRKKYFEKLGIFVGVSAKFNYGARPEYFQMLIELLKYVCLEQNINVLLIPHGLEDLNIMRRLKSAIKSERIHLIEDMLLPEDLKYIISNSEIFIGSRLHSCISSWSCNVPTIALIPKDDHRGLGFSQLLGLQKYCVDPYKDSSSKFISKYKKLWSDKKLTQKFLEDKTPYIKDLSSKNSKYVLEEFVKRYY